MADFHCGSCSYASDDSDEVRKHSRESGHVGIDGKDGVETGAVAEAVPDERKYGKVRLVAECLGALVVVALGAALVSSTRENRDITRENRDITRENQELKSMAGGLVAEVAEQEARIAYLESASGAGTTLNSYREQ